MQQLLITGANRGIGLEFTQQYLAQGWHVYATYRQQPGEALAALACDQLTLLPLDVTEDDSIADLQEQLNGAELDLIINNSGVFGPKDQNLGTVSRQQWLEVLNVNSVAPLMLAQALHENLRAKGGTFAVLSSRMGSIEGNDGGALYLYRSSKAAVNQVVKSLSIDLASQGLLAAALHPGWVRTDMGGPNGLIDANESVAGMVQVIDGLNAATSGHFFNFDGVEIPW